MARAQTVLGWLMVAFLVLSAGAHSGFGWAQMAGELGHAQLPDELLRPVGIAWRLGGATMLAFAAILGHWHWSRGRGELVSPVPAWIVGGTYALYGAWAFPISGGEPFFVVLFLIPGLLMLLSVGRGRAPSGAPSSGASA